jgi:imidazoleglycerol phosphate synthase glutamine amidotransferase subunit HisH
MRAIPSRWLQQALWAKRPSSGRHSCRSICVFNHSYYVPLCAFTIAQCHHIGGFSAALGKDNFWALQFHTEISGRIGEKIFSNFLSIRY